MEIISNVINDKYLQEVYTDTLQDLRNILVKSYGPYGSNTLIQKGENAFPEYTKDGHTILSNVHYNNIIEKTICSNILSITEYIVRNVGDGTTSAVLLSNYILKGLIKLQETLKKYNKIYAPIVIDRTFNAIVDKMIEKIKENGREFTIEDAKKIAMISTNGDTEIADKIAALYEELGKEVYISLNIAHTVDDVVSIYDGLVLESGLIEECYINDPEKKNCTIQNPHIYAFTDPVDTPEMIAFMEQIVKFNIFDPIAAYNQSKEKDENLQIVPTVIITPRFSRDASSFMDKIMDSMSNMNGRNVRNRPPLLIITNLTDVDNDMYSDIMQLCDCKPISKYIDPRIQKKDQEAGLAPTIDNVQYFFGTAEEVIADQYKTTFINPKLMNEVVGTDEGVTIQRSNLYESLVSYLEDEIEKGYANKADMRTIYHLKRRLHSLKASYVEWYVGGVSPSDRDQRKAAIEDAVKNCRSAAKDGVGYGANFEGFKAIRDCLESPIDPDKGLLPLEDAIKQLIYDGYFECTRDLYGQYFVTDTDTKILQMLRTGKPINIADNGDVLSSIRTDELILRGISKIITIMATSNQYICPDPLDTTVYRAAETVRKRKEQEERNKAASEAFDKLAEM